VAFANRREAGKRLAAALSQQEIVNGVVVGLARGGVEVAAVVAADLHLPLDALAVRKVGHPGQPEYALGAVTPGGGSYVRAHDGLSEDEVETAVAAARAKAEALDRSLHAERPPCDPSGKTVVLVDDGLATGATMIAALRWARAAKAAKVVVAVPVGAPDTVSRLEQEVDAVVCLEQPVPLVAVGIWYEEFGQVSDQRVRSLLRNSTRPRPIVGDGVATTRRHRASTAEGDSGGPSRRSPR
jgi:putative phosphoribosyl transferase